MNRLLGVLLVLVLIAVAAVYVGSPFYAFQQLQQAAQAGDRERLEALVDFPAVREDLKRQVDSKAAKLARRVEGVGNPIAAILESLGAALGDRAIDKLVTPEAISAMVQFGETTARRRQDAPADAASKDAEGGARTEVHYGFLSPDRFRASVAPALAPGRPIDLILVRHGLFSWRLEAIQLPKQKPPPVNDKEETP